MHISYGPMLDNTALAVRYGWVVSLFSRPEIHNPDKNPKPKTLNIRNGTCADDIQTDSSAASPLVLTAAFAALLCSFVAPGCPHDRLDLALLPPPLPALLPPAAQLARYGGCSERFPILSLYAPYIRRT